MSAPVDALAHDLTEECRLLLRRGIGWPRFDPLDHSKEDERCIEDAIRRICDRYGLEPALAAHLLTEVMLMAIPHVRAGARP